MAERFLNVLIGLSVAGWAVLGLAGAVLLCLPSLVIAGASLKLSPPGHVWPAHATWP